MIIKAGPELRGQRVSGLLHYLYGPGKAHEHQDARLVAAWANPDDVAPSLTSHGRHDLRQMVRLMELPLRSLPKGCRSAKPVWHCVVRNHPDDPYLSDEQWATIAGQVVDAVGLSDTRWVAVRHDDHGIHIAAVLVTESGDRCRLSWEKNRLDVLRRRLEPRYCTVRTGTTRTGDRRPTRGEHEKASRQGRAEPARTTLRRAVNLAAIGAESDQAFLDHLRRAGVMVGLRHSTQDPDQITGYKVALPGHHTAEGEVIWYSGRCLGAELTWPKLRARWTNCEKHGPDGPIRDPQATEWRQEEVDVGTRHRAALQPQTYRDARRALREVSSMLRANPRLAAELQSPVADVAAAIGNAWDGPHDGRRSRPVTAAADHAQRAGRTPNRGAHRYHLRTAQNLRSVARAVALAGRVAHGDDKAAWMLVVHQVASTLEALGDAQRAEQRADQAAAAHRSATALRAEIEALHPNGPANWHHHGHGLNRSVPSHPAADQLTRPRSAHPDGSPPGRHR